MAKIHILDSGVYNRIAAGEVVDRPASVVKEFVENSIDAGAKKISVAIERGGKELICVTDDGEGVERGELAPAFLPHATSKIQRAEDLEAIGTLGFRGEALASIASVAKVCLRSRFRGAEDAYELTCIGGKMGDIVPCALGEGTEISAENLFFNTPARLKFLKSDKGEESEVTNLVSRLVLGNPNIAFRYLVDGRVVLQSFGGGLDEAVAAVYGGSVLSRCYKLDATKHGIRLRGYIGKPDFAKPNRTYQSLFVNGRYVINSTIGSALSNAYASYLMKRQYPFYVLFVDLPREAVDVNVHPNKADVRFENNQVVYGAIYSVVSSVLDGNASALEFVAETDQADSTADGKAAFEERIAVTRSENLEEKPAVFPENAQKESTLSDINVVYDSKKRESAAPLSPRPPEELFPRRIEFHDSGAAVAQADPAVDVFAENKRYLEMLDRKAAQQKIVFDHAEYKGCLFNTYLLYEEGDSVYLIDQHAAHERLIFDRLRAEMEKRSVMRQPMLVPYVLHVNSAEREFLTENLATLQDIGFEIEAFGLGDFKVSSVPLDLQDIDLASFFEELLKEVGALHSIRLSDLLRDKIAMTACKHAVKGGMMLSDSEKKKLFEMLHGDMGLKCPHGRPIAVRMTKYEIEKMFKRVV